MRRFTPKLDDRLRALIRVIGERVPAREVADAIGVHHATVLAIRNGYSSHGKAAQRNAAGKEAA